MRRSILTTAMLVAAILPASIYASEVRGKVFCTSQTSLAVSVSFSTRSRVKEPRFWSSSKTG